MICKICKIFFFNWEFNKTMVLVKKRKKDCICMCICSYESVRLGGIVPVNPFNGRITLNETAGIKH